MKIRQGQFDVCMQKIKQQINSLSSSRVLSRSVQQPKSSSEFISDIHLAINISNQKVKYQLKHGMAFRDMLEPRDQVLEHQFNFKEEFDRNAITQPFTGSNLYEAIMLKIKGFLAEAISNVISISFNFLCKGDLEGKEAKAFAAKNIILNSHSIYRQTIKAIEGNNMLKQIINMQDLKSYLVIDIDNTLNNILINLADSYPQAPISGGTPRMREVITEVNRVDDEHYDFIHTSGIKLSDVLKLSIQKDKDDKDMEVVQLDQRGDYTQFIMKVMNAAIGVAQESKHDAQKRTIFEKFTEFNQYLFWLNQQKSYQKFISNISQEHKLNDKQKEKQRVGKVQSICGLFDTILSGNTHDIHNQGDSEFKNWDSQAAAQGIETMKAKGVPHFALGQKIPASVKSFTRQQIEGKQFKAKHSSILRILTKWAGCLEDIFQNAQKHIKKRLYPLADIHNNLCNLRIGDSEGDQKLINQLEEEYRQLRKKFDIILRISYGFIADTLSKDKESVVSSVNRYTQTRTVSSKINAVLTSLMLNYTNLLIHHLLKAGRQIRTDGGHKNINLVVFRVSDLMRSKLQCTQSCFINILKTIYLLDNTESLHTKFKLVRIKNKLDDPANNIMINYLFLGKVQCQLQLSIQDSKGKEKNFYTFSHFVYQLTRGKFGSLAQCAIMISQLDPMVNASRGNYYQQKVETIDILKSMRKNNNNYQVEETSIADTEARQSQGIRTDFFECSLCKKLITDQDINKLLQDPQQKLCYSCVVNKPNAQDLLKKELRSTVQNMRKNKLRNYRPFGSFSSQKFMVTLSSSSQLSLTCVTYLPKESKTFTIKVDSKLLQSIELGKISFNSLDYIDVSDIIKKARLKPVSPPFLSYLFDSVALIPPQILKSMNIQPQGLGTKVLKLIHEFKEFRMQKNIIKTIRYKSQIIRANDEQGAVLDRVCRVLVLGENKKKKNNPLKYDKETTLDLSNLDAVTAERANFVAIPKWIKDTYNLKVLIMNENSIKVIQKDFLPLSLKEISLKENCLEQVDVSNLTDLVFLYLKNNKITSLKTTNCSSLKELSIRDNNLEGLDELPPSIETLWVDRMAIIKLDFSQLLFLKLLKIWKGSTQRDQLKNIGERVKVTSMSSP